MDSAAKAIREQLGGSQQWWADYLGITLGQLKMAEGGKRSLPTAALIKLSAIELLDAGKTQAKSSKKKLPNSKQLLAQARKLEQQAQRAQQLLATAQQRYQQASNALSIADQLLKKKITTDEEQKDQRLLETMQYEAGQALVQYGPEAQAYLQWKIDCYTYGAARAKELANQL